MQKQTSTTKHDNDGTIYTSNVNALTAWSEALNTSPEKILVAVSEVGPDAAKVAIYINNKMSDPAHVKGLD